MSRLYWGVVLVTATVAVLAGAAAVGFLILLAVLGTLETWL